MSDAGDVLWVLPPNFKAIIRGRSWLLRLDPVLAGVRNAADYVVRVSFGTTLVASIVLVTATIVAILTASQSSDRDNRRCVRAVPSHARVPHMSGNLARTFYLSNSLRAHSQLRWH